MTEPNYKRILLKISGESFAGSQGYGIDPSAVEFIAEEIKDTQDLGVEIGMVVGGGNIYRGLPGTQKGTERVAGDYMGMLATVINALALQDALEKMGIFTRVMTAIHMEQMAEPYIRRRAIRHLEKKRVVILAGGTGNPYFTTDTAAALRAIEIQAEVILKGTKVNGVYDKDPQTSSDAVMFDSLSYLDVLNRRLKVMDTTAVSLCMDNQLPIIVFNLLQKGNLIKILTGEKLGTVVRG